MKQLSSQKKTRTIFEVSRKIDKLFTENVYIVQL